MESLPRSRLHHFNDTEVSGFTQTRLAFVCRGELIPSSRQAAGHGLLGEMSLAELKERLALLKQERRAEQEERRGHILEEKQRKKQEMLETLDTIELYSRELAKAAADRSVQTSK